MVRQKQMSLSFDDSVAEVEGGLLGCSAGLLSKCFFFNVFARFANKLPYGEITHESTSFKWRA